jgi:LPXTG-motif cell wall-anchored protein
MNMRRLVRAVAVIGLLTASAALAAPAAGAAPVDAPTSVPGTCATYPVQICQAHIMSSTTTPLQGQTIEVSGLGYQPNEDVALTIGGIPVGTAHTDADGNFDPPVVVPATLIGDQPLTGRGASGQPYDVDSLILNIRAAGTGGSSSSGGGGLASTGVEIAAFSAVGAALIIAGIAFAVFGRRRRSAHGS